MGIAANTLYSFAQLGLTRLASVVTLVLLARTQGPELVGVFSLALTFHILLTGWWVGIDDKIIREIARARAAESDAFGARLFTWQTVSGYVGLKGLVSGLLVLLVAGVLFGGGWYTPFQNWFIALLLASSVTDNGISGVIAAYAGNERFSTALALISAQTFLRLLLTGLALWGSSELLAIAGAWLIASVLTALLALFLFVKHFYDSRVRAAFPDSRWSSLIRPAEDWSFVSMGVVVILEYQLDVILLSFFRSAAEVGYYSLATTLFALATLPAQAFRTALYPAMSRVAVQNQPGSAGGMASLQSLYEWAIASVVSIALPGALLGFFFAEPFITFVFGPEMAPAALPTQILMGTVLILSLNVPHSRFLLATNQQAKAALFISASAILNVLANFWLAPLFGPPGAAAARGISTAAFLLLAGLSVGRFVRLPGWRSSAVPLGAGAISAGFLLLTTGWLWWLSAALALLLYAAVWWWISGLTKMWTA